MSNTDRLTASVETSERPSIVSPEHEFVLVRVLHSNETELCSNSPDLHLSVNEIVVLPTKYGVDLGIVLGAVSPHNAGAWKEKREIKRIASESDRETYSQNLERAEEALQVCRDCVRERGLEMKLVSAHYLLEEPKLLFFFTADGRVDFRELVKDLVARFLMRIELRQIGVRDESRVLGGRGVCGRDFCCHGLTDKLSPVSIKMAKMQGLSLNSMKISGPCGRLLCCLAYENDYYVSQKGKLPETGNRVEFEDTQFRIYDVNVLTNQIKLSGEDGRQLSLPACRLRYDNRARRWRVLEEGCCAEVDEPRLPDGTAN